MRIVATSRVRLSIAGEWLVPLSGLPCPEPEDADRVEAFDAVRLFVQAAHRVEPGLVPGSEAAAIVAICRQVEGLPLALELAAAWTRVLSCTAIAEELRHGTEILRAVDATQPARHASIEVVFDQSWRMLTPRERDALARLSIFRGGFSAEAARTIGGASLPVLGALADKSLLHKEDDRLRMHPLVQQLSAQHLPDAARAQAEREHAGYFHRLLARLQPAVSAGERDALQAVDEEFENARLAWAWSVAHGGAPMVRALASVLLHHCQHRGRLDVGLLLLRQGSDAQAARDDERLAAFLLAATAQLEYRLDRYAEAEAFAARALAMARRLRDVDAKLQAMHVLGACCLRVGRHDDARRLFTEALELAPEDVAPRNAAAMLDHLALIEKSARRFPEAVDLALRSLALHRRTGNVGGEALCLNNLGSLYGDRADHATAREYLREGLAVCERHGLVATRGHILANLAGLAAKAGDIAGAARFTAAASEIAQSAGNRLLAGWLTFQRSQLAVKQGDLAEARAQLSAGMALAIEVGAPSLHMNGLDAFIDVLVAAGETASARRVAAFAMEHPDARALEREHFGARLAALPGGPPVAWPGLTLGELAHRLVIERDVAHAPLLAALRSS